MQNLYRGCLIGGAIGDALGWPVEFMRLEEIRNKYGEEGIKTLDIRPGGPAEITDDTQMTMFTAEGLLRAENRGNNKGIVDVPTMVYKSYLRWLSTQGIETDVEKDGWIYPINVLHNRRAPGNTCLSALHSGTIGQVSTPINDSKGCGGVMRTAPVGLLYPKERAFQLGSELAAITHGHPSGFLSAGGLSYIIASILETRDLPLAVERMVEELANWPNHEECSTLVEMALKLAYSDVDDEEAIRTLGEGWVGEEALAISIFCSLRYQDDFQKAVIASVNHNGDSDSTGAITGNILGALLGLEGIPVQWIKDVELKDEIIQLADDVLTRYEESESWHRKYPGW
ncbi:ADP-ribosylglycohydrolase [Mesobacillus persicus]|uniref:ADP-ribosylglycohydrolase n=1 Tax=Mesobacillus persicus TaxID=930146 RepID=A0A1H7VNA2_9BACI|nr:ADP-ribosylglycohydrolase family protein [Mesobacillus persicus]SEM10278.1 ADP-ribosylglycohydrolase [Mesobacillus persicus]